MPYIETDSRSGVKIARTWAAPAVATVKTTIGDFSVTIETMGKNHFDGDQPNWLLAYWAQAAVVAVVGHDTVHPHTSGPRGIPDNSNRHGRHARIVSRNFEKKMVRIEVPSGETDGGREDRQFEVDRPYHLLRMGLSTEEIRDVCGVKIAGVV